MLVTRQIRGDDYRRILVSIDFSAESEALVKLASELDSRATLEIFHAISPLGEARLRSAEATEQAVRAYRGRCLRQAQERMGALMNSLDAGTGRLLTVIGRGDPGRQTVVQQQASGADLVVLGKRRTSAWEDFFCGSVAHQVLGWGSSDVLVVPHAHLQETARLAVRRMKRGLPEAALEIRPAGRRAS